MSMFEEILASMAKNPPDPNGPIPLSNRPATIFGATLPFHVLSWLAVAFRLYTRFKVVRDPGWDDYLVIVAAIFSLCGHISLYDSIRYGLGKHLLYISPENLTTLMIYLYLQHASYLTCTGFVKLSLLCQYLRLFRTGVLRKVCIVLLVFVSFWSILWFMQGWFPCFPVSGFWNRLQTPAPRCWGSGFSSVDAAIASFIAFAASNMALDTIIFAIPMMVYFRPALKKRQVFALLGLFALGSVVVLMSILRLWSAIRQRSHGVNTVDFPWWYPLTQIISFIEIDIAITCASIPIFWPVIVASLPQIFVTQEVRVTRHERVPGSMKGEFELERQGSLKSSTSQEGLTHELAFAKTDYGDQYVKEHVLGQVPQTTEIAAGAMPKKKWPS